MNTNIQFKAKSIAEIEAVFAYYRSLGYKIDDVSVERYLSRYPYIVIKNNREIGGFVHFNDNNGKLVEFKDFFIIPPEVETVVLSPQYTAEISLDGIKVGCQTFPLSIIDLLMEAKNKICK